MILRPNPSGDIPIIHPAAFIDPSAIICGKVIIGANVFVGPYAVIRADETDNSGSMHPIVIKDNTNIQDGVVIHSKSGASVQIGSHTSIAHRAIIHGPCTIEDKVFIGFNAVVFNAHIAKGCVIRHNAVVEDCYLSAGKYVPSTTHIHHQTDVHGLDDVSSCSYEFSESVAKTNIYLSQAYKKIFLL